MNILEYIESLMARGMSEEDAGRCADCLFNTDWDCSDESSLSEDYYCEGVDFDED